MRKLFRRKPIQAILAESTDSEHSLQRNLNVRDLTSLGIAAVVGAGIFGTIGNAAASGGPAVSLLFVFTAIACGFSALCYAEFASRIPISGSAYTYAYATFGELIAWIIGWDLLMEYAIGNVAVAIPWSDYFTGFVSGLGWHIPEYFCMDYLSALRGHEAAIKELASGKQLNQLSAAMQAASEAWSTAPQISGIRVIMDLPAFTIVLLITWLVYVGIKESKTAGNIMVGLKVGVIVLVIVVGAFYVQPANWDPFAPNGMSGVMKGVSAVFFAFIGFDALSTTAEECHNPQKDLPRAMMNSLIICTILYVLISLVLTGMVPFTELAVGDPLAYVFGQKNLHWMVGIVSFSAIIAMASVLLVFQMGQPRIWMSMSRDGLLPKAFSRIHKKYKTPSFSTIVTGLVVAIPVLFMNLTEVTDLTSIGTLFAFTLVCGGVLLLEDRGDVGASRFRVPYINSKYITSLLMIGLVTALASYDSESVIKFLNFQEGWTHKIPQFGFWIAFVLLSVLSYLKSLSLIPVLGLLCNLYLISELGILNWERFLIWLAIGLVIYFLYGKNHSKLNKSVQNT